MGRKKTNSSLRVDKNGNYIGGIIVRENDNPSSVIKRFSSYVERERILSTYLKKQQFISNTEKRKIRERRSFYRMLKNQKKSKNYF